MATVKQTKAIYKKILFHANHLRQAIWKAQNMGIIKVENGEYKEKSPLYTYYEMSNRIDSGAEKAFAEAFRKDVKSTLKGVY